MMRKLKITNFITRKIDYIFVSKDLKVPYSDIPDIVSSDHRPHVAAIELE
jgi:endonuclease/exonuclease/phosphatase family metal-dependent hydrolase